ncbi:hypothetical protein LMG28727_06194 [Paraburkholderia kirstenboschensis]|nr:hypothetical protein LMG28727_06194 [Paraburkholderia kirstenboschensis]
MTRRWTVVAAMFASTFLLGCAVRSIRVNWAALRKAGYDPSPWYDDPYYPDDLQAAQRLVDYWFQTECQVAVGLTGVNVLTVRGPSPGTRSAA